MTSSSPASAKPAKLSLLPDELAAIKPMPALGLVAPFDFRLDAECWRWLPPQTSLYVTRTSRVEDETVTVELAQAVSEGEDVARAVDSLVANDPQAIAYACTSGSFVGGVAGERKLCQAMLDAGAPAAVTPSGAMVEALHHLGAKRVAVATPYIESLTTLLAEFLQEAGFEVVSNGYLDKDSEIFNVSYEAVKYLAATVDRPDADAIFFSCTNMRTFDIIEELEQALGKPVLSANQVTMWAALRAANLPLPKLNQRLFSEPKLQYSTDTLLEPGKVLH
ncbi:MAG: maleate cis-trans isomerase family protein [Candidatus Saccharimonadales bacterium]